MHILFNQFDKAQQVLAQAEARKVDSPLFWELRYELAFLTGSATDIEHQVNAAMSDGQIGVLASQADTEAYHGHLAKVRDLTRRAVDLARRNGDTESAIGYEIVGALREADFGNFKRAQKQVAHALASQPGERSKALGALALARAGEASKAQTLVHDLQREFPSNTLVNSYWIPTVLGAIQSRKNPSKPSSRSIWRCPTN